MHLTYLSDGGGKKNLIMHLGSEKNARRKLEEKGGEIKVDFSQRIYSEIQSRLSAKCIQGIMSLSAIIFQVQDHKEMKFAFTLQHANLIQPWMEAKPGNACCSHMKTRKLTGS